MDIRGIFYRIIVISLLVITVACDKGNDLELKPVFRMGEIGTLKSNYSYLSAEMDADQRDELIPMISSYGFVWSTHSDNTKSNASVIEFTTPLEHNSFSSLIRNLVSKTRYYARAFMVINGQVHYSNEVSFVTPAGTWKRLNDFPGGGFTQGTGFALNGIGYVVSGNQVWAYDPDRDQWTQKSDFPITTLGPTSVVVNEVAYVFCGALYQYDDIIDAWTVLPMPSEAWLNRGCDGPGAFAVDEKIYIAGGRSTPNYGIVAFNVTSQAWSLLPYTHQTPYASYTATFSVNNIGYVVGGAEASGWMTSDVLSYDVRENNWSRGIFIGTGGYEIEPGKMLSFVIDDKAYVAYWSDGQKLFHFNTRTNSVENLSIAAILDGNAATWPSRKGGILFAIGKNGYVGFGSNNEGTILHNDFWQFGPD